MKIFRHKNSGFGLIEILVTLGVLSVGILGVTTLHGVIARQSSDNKARSEALNIAQSRLEDMRNYTNAAGSVTGFNDLYDDTTGFDNSENITGISADFVRSESIATTGTMKQVIVRVGWTDPSGVGQTVSLNTEFSFVSPRKVGDSALEASGEKVASPTGRARLGDGTVTEEQISDESTQDNNDGTKELIVGQDRLLAVGTDVVLTLVDACQTEEGSCADFVRINGRIYIDRDQLSVAPGAVHVIASDAAFCARHYVPEGLTEDDRIPVTNDDTSTITTSANSSGEYEYFDYTCYLGGGWHGNVGLLISGNVNWDGCVGDPTAGDGNWQSPIRASRRVYRGMLYKIDLSEDDDKEKVEGTSLVQYYSQGVGDSVILPVPDSGDATHDFVLTGAFSSSQLGDPNPCLNLGPMTRTDSNVNGNAGDLFEGMPRDFYCLNDGYTNELTTLDVIPDGFGVESHTSYGNTCPYNPADPPAALHHITGDITMTAPVTVDNDVLAAGIGAFTSDGPGTCIMGTVMPDVATATYTRNYDCVVYDWSTIIDENTITLNGWTGYIEVDYDQSSMSCDPNRISFTDQTTDSAGHNFTNCSPGSFIYFTGTVISTPNNREISTISISDVGGSCTLAGDGLSFTCLTDELPLNTWTGTISITSDANIVCTATGTGANPGVFAYVDEPSGFVDLQVTLSNNTGSCP